GSVRAPGNTKEQVTECTTVSPGSHWRLLSPDRVEFKGDMSKEEEEEDDGESDGTSADETLEVVDTDVGALDLGASAMMRAIRAWCEHWPLESVAGDVQRAPVCVVAEHVPGIVRDDDDFDYDGQPFFALSMRILTETVVFNVATG
ncbi:hypothetical protein L917_08403, partial [Phytophthora nicotianae]